MNYLLFNPKSNNGNNDINIIDKSIGGRELTKINLLDIDVKDFVPTLTENDKVFLCGGDGTICRFANNTYGFEFPCPVYIIQSGTGNDFLRDIGAFGGKLVDVRPYFKDLPVVTINGVETRFLNGVGFGLDGAVCEAADELKKHSTKKVNYLGLAIQLIMGKYKRPNGRAIIDGVEYTYKKMWIASAMMGKYYGGGMMVAPNQDRHSGKLGAMMFHGGARPKILTVLPTIYKGEHVKFKKIVEMFECEEMYVEFDIPTALQIDGETVSGVVSYTARTAKKHLEYLDKLESERIEMLQAKTPSECEECVEECTVETASECEECVL